VWVALTNLFGTQLVDFATRQRPPSLFVNARWVEAGGLMGYGPSYPEMFRRAATMADKILRGAKPADCPWSSPRSSSWSST